jgi:hypothetical protein
MVSETTPVVLAKDTTHGGLDRSATTGGLETLKAAEVDDRIRQLPDVTVGMESIRDPKYVVLLQRERPRVSRPDATAADGSDPLRPGAALFAVWRPLPAAHRRSHGLAQVLHTGLTSVPGHADGQVKGGK